MSISLSHCCLVIHTSIIDHFTIYVELHKGYTYQCMAKASVALYCDELDHDEMCVILSCCQTGIVNV